MANKFVLAFFAVFVVSTSAAAPLVRTFAQNDVRVVVSVEPALVDPAVDNVVVVTVAGPRGSGASLPADMADRFDGFVIDGEFTDSRYTDFAGEISRNFKLRPVPGAEQYRVRPFAVTYLDASSNPPVQHWFPTEMMTLRTTGGGVAGEVTHDLKARHIAPSYKDVPRYIAYALGLTALLAALAFTASRIRLAKKIRMMTPGERALRELRLLLEKHLPEKGLFKDFYIELTMVVRRYIERRHGIRAPEQTTEEFLAAASSGETLHAATVAELQTFLTAADLIKFAGREATIAMAAEATEKARSFVFGN